MLSMYNQFASNVTNTYVLFDQHDKVDTTPCGLLVLPDLSLATEEFYVMLYFIETGDLIIYISIEKETLLMHKEHMTEHASKIVLPKIFATTLNECTRPEKGKNMIMTILMNDMTRDNIDHVKGRHVLVGMIHMIRMVALRTRADSDLDKYKFRGTWKCTERTPDGRCDKWVVDDGIIKEKQRGCFPEDTLVVADIKYENVQRALDAIMWFPNISMDAQIGVKRMHQSNARSNQRLINQSRRFFLIFHTLSIKLRVYMTKIGSFCHKYMFL